jgi:hypothetical protein
MAWSLSSPGDPGLAYQVASSFGSGPIPIDARFLDLAPDTLLWLSAGGMLPTTFRDYAGTLDASGRGNATLVIPPDSALVGIPVHTGFLTLCGTAPSGVQSISNTVGFQVQS